MATNQRYVKTGTDIVAQRSRMPLNRRTLMSYFHGYLHPVGTPIEVLPGDTLKAVISVFTRMSTPIVPFMDDIRQEIDAFFVPKRILWNKTKQFYGEAPSFGIADKVYEPHVLFNSTVFHPEVVSRLNSNLLKSESFAAAFGLIMDEGDNSNRGAHAPVNLLPIRAFLSIYNEYYRDENYQDQYVWNKDSSGLTTVLATLGGSSIFGISLLPKVNKDRDVVTSILPYQIKGDPVILSIGEEAPVITKGTEHDAGSSSLLWRGFDGVGYNQILRRDGGLTHSQDLSGVGGGHTTLRTPATSGSSDPLVAPSNLYADLSLATGVSISNLIYSLAYQDFLARAAHFGTRYKEYIYGMFGTRIADASEDIPEYLGRLKLRINVNQVVQTTGFEASSNTELGALGAYSNSGNTGKLFTKSFAEPGYVVLVTYTKHQRTYSSGIDRVFLKSELLDYFQPPFANIADVPFGSYNIWFNDADETSLGFQEPWYDYRGLQDRVYGLMNPKVDTMGEIWTLAEKWATKPTIGAEFMKEDRDAIARVLSTGVNGPDYIMDFRLEIDATRVMPLFASGRLRVM